ncbi:MAG TPA: hypothetical protein VF676_10700 [Flavobacterium sp.]|jgi:hypothetical protein
MKKIALLLLLGTAAISAQQTAFESPQTQNIYRSADTDTKPELADGMYTLSMFISKNLKLPETHNRKLMLFIGFVVEPDSTISDIRFIHLSAEKLYEKESDSAEDSYDLAADPAFEKLGEQAVRVVKQFKGRWIPATKDGLPVRCQYNFPIIINIE